MTDLKDIRAFAFDVDGIFTDGSVISLDNGELLRVFNAKDSFAIRTAVLAGFKIAIITGGCSNSIVSRFQTLNIPKENIFLLSKDKLTDLKHFCEHNNLRLSDVAFAGDDMPDVPAIKAAGLGICPADACIEAREAADWISPIKGGHLFVRDFVERVLKIQNKWHFDPHREWGFSYPDKIASLANQTGRRMESND